MKKIILFLSLLMISQISFAQDSISTIKQKPKIGLVLSGGGAKGMAHIGVLKVIDSLGIKIDFVGGTSMGAIIGGLYASGYSGKELEYIFKQVDVDAVLQDYTPRGSKSFFEKRNDEIYLATLPFNNFKISLPTGLSKGLYNFNLLSKLTHHVSHVTDFQKLPIPFFCVATDVENGEEVILDKGILAKVMIASGALPTLYSPVELDGRLLIDGGVVNNYPVEELLKRGVNYVIGVDVQDNLKSKDNLTDVYGVLLQISNYSMLEKMESKRNLTDIYIKPNIKGYSVVSFEKAEEIIPKGEREARFYIEQLELLKSDIGSEFVVKKHLDSLYVNSVTFNELENYTRAYVIGKLKFNNNSKISFKDLEKGINNLSATNNFKSISYSFEKAGEKENLILNLEENKINTFLKFGLHYDELLKSSALLNFTQKKLITKNDVFSLDLILGDNTRYNLNYYIDNGFYWSFGVNSKYIGFNKNISTDFNNGAFLASSGANSINVDYLDFSNQLYLQTIFVQKFSIGVGAESKYLKIKSETLGTTNPVFDKSNYLSFFGYMKFDSFDQKYFPRKGVFFNGEIKSFVHSSDYTNTFKNFSIAKGEISIAQTFFKKFVLKLNSEAGFGIGEKSVNVFDFALGGFGFASVNNIKPFLGYDFLQLSGDSYIKGSATLDCVVLKKHHINFTANYTNIGTNIFEDDTWISRPQYSGYSFGYGIESLIGPIEIKHSWSPETHKHYTWFTVGFYF
jgi:NTE family protein